MKTYENHGSHKEGDGRWRAGEDKKKTACILLFHNNVIQAVF